MKSALTEYNITYDTQYLEYSIRSLLQAIDILGSLYIMLSRELEGC